MKSTLSLLAIILLAALGAATPHASSSALHFALSKSVPAADASVPSPAELRFWFTELPQENSVAIRLVDPAGEPVGTGEPTPDEQDGKILTVSVPEALPAGTYTVAWRGIGGDGHVVRGDFAFSVTAR